jgi:hypothetical protein
MTNIITDTCSYEKYSDIKQTFSSWHFQLACSFALSVLLLMTNDVKNGSGTVSCGTMNTASCFNKKKIDVFGIISASLYQ